MDPVKIAMLVWELQRGVENDAQDKDISIQKYQITESAPSSFSRALGWVPKTFPSFLWMNCWGKISLHLKLGVKAG